MRVYTVACVYALIKSVGMYYIKLYVVRILIYYTALYHTIQSVEAKGLVQDDIVDYLEAKQQLLLAYCMNITFYLYLKVQHIYTSIYKPIYNTY